MSLTSRFAEEVKSARKAAGYTQEQLAEIVDITPRSLQYIESGAWLPHQTTMLRLMSVLNINADTFREETICDVPLFLLQGKKTRR